MHIANYPNPFNPNTKIEYYVPEASDISVDIFNVKGQKVNNLSSGHHAKGMHEIFWNGEDFMGKRLSSGVYFASYKFRNKQVTQKMIMLR